MSPEFQHLGMFCFFTSAQENYVWQLKTKLIPKVKKKNAAACQQVLGNS